MNNKEKLLKMLNKIMLNTAELIDQLLNYDTIVTDKDISNAYRSRKLLENLEVLEELPF